MFSVYIPGPGWRWVDTDWLRDKYNEFDTQCALYESTDGEEGVDYSDYQSDSPYAEYVTGYNTDSYADDSIAACQRVWDRYVDECDEPDWEEYLDLCWDDFDYQCCHTWLRVTNMKLSDEQCRLAARDSDDCTMKSVLGM